jgi:hypothetical protein
MQHPVDVIAGGTGNIDLAKAAALLPWETMQGLKMNVNRPFGGGARSANGTMTTGVQVEPDQPGLKGETFGQFLNLTSGTQAVPFAYDAFGMAADSLAARQLYAKHLYVLMTLTCDSKAIETRLGSAEARARYIAQWAVNCVAYRDHNAIMIPFNYVVNPVADGWNPDGRVVHTVWGCKRPDLLITEALAIHDRRTDDLEDEKVDPANKKYGATDERKDPGKTKETDPKKKDPNFDQRFRPQGSLFVELFNPWSPLALQSRDLLVGAPPAVSSGVMLNQTAGDAAGASPVWRLIIVDPQRNAVNGGELPDPDDPTTNVTIERVVYFVPKTGMKVPGDSPANAIYTPSASKVMLVQAGQYAVIGPGEEREGPSKTRTFIGLDSSKKVGSLQGRYLTLDEGDLTTNGAVARNNVPTSPAASTIKTPVSLRIDTPRRLSVSEPINGYNKYEKDVSGADGGAVTYDAATEQYSATIDIPLDLQRDEDEAGIAKILNNDGTYVGYRIIYLQRLADPTRPYAPATDGNINAANPYRTIDAIPVDLTTFNGVSAEADPDNKPAAASPRHFEARQRGDTNAAPVEINLWKQEQYRKTNWDGAAGQVSNALYKDGLKTSLGYLNDAFFRFFGAPMDQSTGYQGDPPAPFPWFNWAYRPYVNEYELLQVPAASSSKLLANNGNPRMYYGYVDQSVRGAGLDAYSPISNFPHLLNLFDSGQSSAQGQTPQFHRVLAYLGVPTPYANMSVQARADAASAGAHWFHPPYNNISTYREPGRINLNTISSPDVFAGLVNYHPALSQAPIWDRFLRSRRGSGAGNMTIDANVPSRFMRPFRTPGGASLTPPGVQESPREVDVGLLRSDPVDPKRPLFQIDDAATGVPPQAGGTPDAFPWATMDYNRSSYFRYQGIQRLAGATTCHSNVFAVWLTIGYFEVVPARNPAAADAAGNRIYPDGYELGGELGSDGSDVVRHRAFYIFDRSLPHGFMRGQDINHDKAILLKRFVE